MVTILATQHMRILAVASSRNCHPLTLFQCNCHKFMTFSLLQGKGGSWDQASSLSPGSLLFNHNKTTKLLTLGRSSSPLCLGHLELGAQDHTQASSENLQRGRSYRLSGQHMAEPGSSYSQNCFLICRQNFCVSVCAHDTSAIYVNSRKQYSMCFPRESRLLELSSCFMLFPNS